MSLLYLACWFHSLAKLKMHSESTLSCLTTVTAAFGRTMRRFKMQTCDHIPTFELDRELDARARRLARENPAAPTSAGGKKQKSFNLFTYKFHALGNYVSSIRRFGTTDSYSTAIVSLHPSPLCLINPRRPIPVRTRTSHLESGISTHQQIRSCKTAFKH